MVDLDADEVLDRLDEQRLAAVRVRGGDLVLAVAGDGDEEGKWIIWIDVGSAGTWTRTMTSARPRSFLPRLSAPTTRKFVPLPAAGTWIGVPSRAVVGGGALGSSSAWVTLPETFQPR